MLQELVRASSAEVSFGVSREIFSWRGQCEGFDKLVFFEQTICFLRTPSRSNVFNRGADENKSALLVVQGLERELIDESFNVELTQHEFLCLGVIANKADVLVNLSLRIFFLRRVNGLVRDLDESIMEPESVGAFRLPYSGFAMDFTFPCSKERTQWLPDIRFSWAGGAAEWDWREQ